VNWISSLKEKKNDNNKDIHKFGIPLVMVQQKLGHYSLLRT